MITDDEIRTLRSMLESMIAVCDRAMGAGPRFDTMAHWLARARCEATLPHVMRADLAAARAVGAAPVEQSVAIDSAEILRDSLDADVLDPEAMSDEEVDAEIRAHGGDPEAIGQRGAAFVAELLAKRRKRPP